MLGPTNTGKTHYAIERMLSFRSGILGLPLRLLAREVYDRIVKVRGPAAVALITGEERIAPETARFHVATVEAMPLDLAVDFLGVDEVQLCADRDRGHIFTDRLLRARGQAETLFLGSDTARPILRKLIPDIEILRRERMSKLTYAGVRKVTKLPRRSAIVAFSAENVYAIAELIRRHRGGAAVVMGALSPRTRNAQVALYQSGEVDFLVATDAIGMGLNMDVEHVAFAQASKFDGDTTRALRADEIAQIAGRAGRYVTDGAFGETVDCPPFDSEMIERVENHHFDALTSAEWRNSALAFDRVEDLLASLEAQAPDPILRRARPATDEETLRRLVADPHLRAAAKGKAGVRRLWELCQLPDFRNGTIDEHVRLVRQFAGPLLRQRGVLDPDLLAREISHCDRLEGSIEQISARLAQIRTWTYAANRPDWVADPAHWRERARAVEDKLSDALHALLSERFVNRRTTALLAGLRREDALLAGVTAAGEVIVEGHSVGRLQGLHFDADPLAFGLEERALRNAAQRALKPEIARRVGLLLQAPDSAFALDDQGRLLWEGCAVGALRQAHVLAPDCRALANDAISDAQSQRIGDRLRAFLAREMAKMLPAFAAVEALAQQADASAALRAFAYAWREATGLLPRAEFPDFAHLTRADRARLGQAGVSIGAAFAFAPRHLKPRSAAFLALLRRAASGKAMEEALNAPAPAAIAMPLVAEWSARDYAAWGFWPVGAIALRVDMIERGLKALARPVAAAPAAASGGQMSETPASPDLAALAVADAARLWRVRPNEAVEIIKAIGWRWKLDPGGLSGAWRAPQRPASTPSRPTQASRAPAPTNSPFAALASLTFQTTAPRRPRRRKSAATRAHPAKKAE